MNVFYYNKFTSSARDRSPLAGQTAVSSWRISNDWLGSPGDDARNDAVVHLGGNTKCPQDIIYSFIKLPDGTFFFEYKALQIQCLEINVGKVWMGK